MRGPQSSLLTPTAAVPYLAISLGLLTCIDSAHSARAGGVRSPHEGISDIRVAEEPSCVPPRPTCYDSKVLCEAKSCVRLVSRFRSSHDFAALSFANFGIEGH